MSNRTGRGGFRPKTTKRKVAAVEEMLTGRVSQSQPDLQSLPRDGAIARKQREFYAMDLSDIEFRTLGQLGYMPVGKPVIGRLSSRSSAFGLPYGEEAPDAGLRRYLNRGRFNAKNPA